MYPLYWTTSKEGIIMRYSYEFKRKCVEMYHQRLYPDTPEGLDPKLFRGKVREWVKIEEPAEQMLFVIKATIEIGLQKLNLNLC